MLNLKKQNSERMDISEDKTQTCSLVINTGTLKNDGPKSMCQVSNLEFERKQLQPLYLIFEKKKKASLAIMD